MYFGFFRSILTGPMACAISGGGDAKASPAIADDAKNARRVEKDWLSFVTDVSQIFVGLCCRGALLLPLKAEAVVDAINKTTAQMLA